VNNVFSRASIDAVHFGYERVWYTYAASALTPLPAGMTQIFDVSNWNPNDNVEKICTIDRIAVTQNSGVQLVWSYDGKQSDASQGWTDGFPAGMRALNVNIMARSRLALFVNNLTGSSISNFQLNYAVTVMNPSVSEDLLLGYPPSQNDLDLVSTLDHANSNGQQISAYSELQAAVNKGTQPLTFSRIFDLMFANRLLPDDPASVPFHLTIPAGAALSSVSASRPIRVPSGEVYILRGIALEGAPAVMLLADRDSDAQYIAVYGTSFTQADDKPWDFFVPFRSQISFYFTNLTTLSSSTTYPGRLEISRYKLSDLLSIHLQLSKTPAQNYAKVKAGWQ
jgi:hypothetical protein